MVTELLEAVDQPCDRWKRGALQAAHARGRVKKKPIVPFEHATKT